MSQAYSLDEQAVGKIKLSINRIAKRYPFHAKFLEQFEISRWPELPTMGVTIRNEKLLLVYNPDFVRSISLAELSGVLLHEVHHVLFNHLMATAKEFPDEWARTVAEEVTVNEFVKERLPAGCIMLDQFPELPPMESTAKRYRRLRKVRRRFSLEAPQFGGTSVDTSAGQETDKSESPEMSESKQESQVGMRQTVDDHSLWQQARKDPQGASAAIRAAVQQAVLETGQGNVPDLLQSAIQGLGVGTTPGFAETRLHGDRQGHVDWRRLLRRYLGQVLEQQPVFNRPPRRFPDLVGIIPGQSRRGRKPEVMAVIDTSGSITDDLLELMDAELRRLSRFFNVTVVECDDIIHHVFRYRHLDSVTGRGGTDLRPPLENAFLRKHHADAVVYFTDGAGPAPDNAPKVPVIWCLVPGGEPPTTWGRVIRMMPPLDGNSGESH